MQPTLEGTWYPSDVSPHLLFIGGALIGMATATPRFNGDFAAWRAFDMRDCGGTTGEPVFLGEFKDFQAAKGQIEMTVFGSKMRPV